MRSIENYAEQNRPTMQLNTATGTYKLSSNQIE